MNTGSPTNGNDGATAWATANADDAKIQALRRFQAQPTDIYIAAFPKSGATLLQMMLYQLTTDGSMDFPHIHLVAPSLDEATMNREQHLESLPQPRIFKTHWTWDVLAETVAASRVLYIVRHPGDVLVSAYHQRVMQLGREVSFDYYVSQEFLLVPPFGSWSDHTASWWPHRNRPNVLFLRYEAVVANLPAAIERVAAFCDIAASSSAFARTLRRCQIDFMKQHWTKFDPRLRTSLRESPEFIRQGTSGGWREQLPVAVQRRVEEEVDRVAAVADGLAEIVRASQGTTGLV